MESSVADPSDLDPSEEHDSTEELPAWAAAFAVVVGEIEALHGSTDAKVLYPIARRPSSKSLTWKQREDWEGREQVLAVWFLPLGNDGREVNVGIAVDSSQRLVKARAWNQGIVGRYPANARSEHCDVDGLRKLASRVGLLPPLGEPRTSTAAQLERSLKLLLGSTTGDLPRGAVQQILSDFRAGTLPRTRS